MLTLCLIALVPVLAASASVLSNKNTKTTYFPKPNGWMLKPVAERESPELPDPRVMASRSSVLASDDWFVVQTYYAATGSNCNYESTMKVVYATNYCFQTDATSSAIFSCSSG